VGDPRIKEENQTEVFFWRPAEKFRDVAANFVILSTAPLLHAAPAHAGISLALLCVSAVEAAFAFNS
jgi:hypothetical protein